MVGFWREINHSLAVEMLEGAARPQLADNRPKELWTMTRRVLPSADRVCHLRNALRQGASLIIGSLAPARRVIILTAWVVAPASAVAAQSVARDDSAAFVRVNQLGYLPDAPKVRSSARC